MWTSTLLSIFKCTAHFTTLNTQHNNYNFGTQAIYPTHLTATADQELKDGSHGDSLPSSLVMTKYSEVQNNKSMCWVHCAGLSLTHTYIQRITCSLPTLYVHTDRTHAHTAKHPSNRTEHHALSFWTHCCEDSWWTKASGRGGVQSPSTWCTQMEHNTKRSTHFNSGTEKMLLTNDEVK